MELSLTRIALFAALVAALGLVPQFLLASGVPITAQSMGIMLCGTVLGARQGGLAVLLFVVLVLLGLPLLSGGRGGLGLLASPTVGFLLGFPVAAFVTGWLMARFRHLPVFGAATLAALLGGVAVLYVPGILGMALILDKNVTEAAILAAPFLPGDLIKAVLTGGVTSGLARARPGLVRG